MSTIRYLTKRDLKRLAKGPGLCLVCGVSLPPGRRTRCSTECSEIADLLEGGSARRRHVLKRDSGVCANCGLDTAKVRRVVAWSLYGAAWKVGRLDYEFGIGRELAALGIRYEWLRWEADHIVPVCEGGGVWLGMTKAELLGNLRTLCGECHKLETASLAKRRALTNTGLTT